MNLRGPSDRLFHVPAVQSNCRILVLGLGGAGCNSVARMFEGWKEGPAVVAMNTDTQVLASCAVPRCVQIGANATHGLGTSGDSLLGKIAAEESLSAIQEVLAEHEIVFLVVGLGGGTGTGAAPVIAQAARRLGVLTICFATMPFPFEGERKRRQAEEGLRTLQQAADIVICLPNQRLMESVDENTGLADAFRHSDVMIGSGVQAIWRLLAQTGFINLDFADLRTLAERSGSTCAFGYAEAEGPGRLAAVLQKLMDNPMLEKGRFISEASALLVCITGGPDLTVANVQGIMGQLGSMARPGVHLFFGAYIDSSYKEKLSLTILTSENWNDNRRARAVEPALSASKNADDTAADTDMAVAAAAKSGKKVEQGTLAFDVAIDKGRFKGVEPTFFDGQDLDIPTYLRQGIRLSYEK